MWKLFNIYFIILAAFNRYIEVADETYTVLLSPS